MDPREREGRKGRLVHWLSAHFARSRGGRAEPEPRIQGRGPEQGASEAKPSDILRSAKAEILDAWERGVRQMPANREPSRPDLLNEIPAMLEEIAERADVLGAGLSPEPAATAAMADAGERLGSGFDLGAVVAAYAMLRSAITRSLGQKQDLPCGPEALLSIHQAIDAAIAAAVERYTRMRDQAATESRAELERVLVQVDVERLRFRDLVNNLDHVVVWEADAETLRFSFVSDRALAVTGMTAAEWTNAPDFWGTHVPSPDREALFGRFRDCLESRTDARMDHRFLRPDGRVLWFHTGVHRTEPAGTPMFQGVSVDVTELREAIQARDQVLEIVSHDLRNPLSVITMNLELLARRAPPGEAGAELRQRAETLLRHARHMARIIGDLVDLTALSTKRLSVARRPEDPRSIMEEAVASFEAKASAKGLVLRGEVAGEWPRVVCDHDRVLQILGNLLSNAIHATEPGGSVVVRVEPRGEEVVFSVADTGRGISAEHQRNLFKPYFRGDATYKGSGLGLAISHGLVTAQGGRIWVESEVGRGTTFFFSLPVDRA
ncbi:PAS domain-containing sensor histidine kinase [Polyangium sp. y55x31]|uniref:sensor histidine kinase n=1 Tax=Polyangium sp. y55x31 TaxID=3042688 RepID=UPI0024831CB4|nr:PAS domain-containing sensor histidine kinase [Polyangium sp. y55x31]MDI1477790.1 PAS domain-containing sensor histidine kinase [Polyangium sp. y55x31]